MMDEPCCSLEVKSSAEHTLPGASWKESEADETEASNTLLNARERATVRQESINSQKEETNDCLGNLHFFSLSSASFGHLS